MNRLAPIGRLTLGAAISLSLPPYGLWMLTPIGLGLHLRLSQASTKRRQLLNTFSLWVGYYGVALVWMTDLTVAGWLVAIPVQAVIMSAPMALVPDSGTGRSIAFPAALVVAEAIRWVLPFGGVPMSSLAMGPVDSYLVDTVRVSGPLLLIASIGVLAIAVEGALSTQIRQVIIALAAVLSVVALAQIAPVGTSNTVIQGSVVQAGGQLGTRAASSDEAAVFTRHLEAVERHNVETDLMVWSESSVSTFAPLEQSKELKTIAQLANRLDAVIIANFSEIEGDYFRNASVAIEPAGNISGRYDKVHLVPFGEYIPLRSVVEKFADLSLISREALPGSGPGVVNSSLGLIGNVISFEVYFPERVRSGNKEGAQVITNPTLASSYENSLVPEQSLASARLRAIESDRWVLQASTTGYSAIVAPDGRVVQRSNLREQTVLSSSIELRSGQTWATSLGKRPITLFAAFLLIASALVSSRSRRSK
ncbi:MAG: apolipoprotein N-acyltransferase [Acidimicrobiaceae bacterium]|nr:apolipoprotein N-acyltransferase [Acidimicrobiaceae bacterium]|tara:strand:+ start:417 stop:1853 length:1437 start_codon:yes stop_codon:yes gene_type:complete